MRYAVCDMRFALCDTTTIAQILALTTTNKFHSAQHILHNAYHKLHSAYRTPHSAKTIYPTLQLTILGNTSAIPAYDRHPTAQILQIRGRTLLLDCGEGTQFQMLKYDIKHRSIEHIFISHLHGDHFFGLAGLFMNWELSKRKNPVHVYTPEVEQLKQMMDVLLQTANEALPYEIIYHAAFEPEDGIILDTPEFSVQAFPQSHRIPCAGYVFREKSFPPKIRSGLISGLQIPFDQIKNIRLGADFVSADGTVHTKETLLDPQILPRAYAFCTDTLFLPENARFIQNVDLLYHETTFDKARPERALATCHSTTVEAGQMAILAKADWLLIGHFSARYEDLSPLLEEARSIFPQTDLAIEGQIFEIPQKTLNP